MCFHCGKLELINVSLTKTFFTLPDPAAAALERTVVCGHWELLPPGPRGKEEQKPPSRCRIKCQLQATASERGLDTRKRWMIVFLSRSQGFGWAEFRACQIRSLCYTEHKPPWNVKKNQQEKKNLPNANSGEIFVSRLLQMLQLFFHIALSLGSTLPQLEGGIHLCYLIPELFELLSHEKKKLFRLCDNFICGKPWFIPNSPPLKVFSPP